MKFNLIKPYALPMSLLCLAVTFSLWPTGQLSPAEPTAQTPPQAEAQADNVAYQTSKPFSPGLTPRSQTQDINSPAVGLADKSYPVIGEQLYTGDRKVNGQIITKDGRVFPLHTYKTFGMPNDPSANQWWVATNGMTQVWDIPASALRSKIAIIDTGFALNHQEFSGRWAINGGESGPTTNQRLAGPNCTTQALPLDKSCNGIDDDANGLIDDYRGWDFVNSDASSQAGETNPAGTGTKHGTMVAGVAAATGNNGVGIAGVNWYSTILPVQALNDDSYGDSFTVGQSIYYAADQGADVISISLGTSADDAYMHEAVRYALSKGSVVVAATGNDGCDCISYPANYPEVIAVGASKPDGTTASFSSYGANLDIIAPGQGMTSSTWSNTNGASAYANNLAGTSFATPFIGGLLGLARTYQPNANWTEITGAMFENADKRTLTAAAPRTNQLGYGYARASTMLARLQTPQNSVQRYSFSPMAADAARAYQCENTLPSTLLYELSSSTQLRYTASPLTQSGLSLRSAHYTCIGLPTDTTSTLRIINLAQETKNRQIKQ
ncbi:MAG: S8 family serine peptidase [Candidatus Saccharimonadales bacterium]